VTDSWMKARTKGQHPEPEQVSGQPRPPQAPPDAAAGSDVQQAMQMLTLAQRTADEHVATAYRQAETIQAEARASAEQIVREAQGQAEAVRREADKALTDARAQAEQSGRDVQAQAGTARKNGEKVVADARAQAAEITREAQANADGLDRLARQRYDEEVGNLAVKREALQEQIESLQGFERTYRSRLLTFMQAQLRALWVDEPQVDGAIDPAPGPAATPPAATAPAPTAASKNGEPKHGAGANAGPAAASG
jgi:vacuolar-type H+-ATPase subunit H